LLEEDAATKEYFEKNWIKKSVARYIDWPCYKIMERLEKQGVQTRPFFIGIHEQPALKKQGYFKNELYPVTEKISRSGFYLPSGQAITDEQINKVIETIKGLF
ncbi:MAG: DegT/DnrJ/EryC1/StrS family aminotransferase, partial [Candidatus Omnitrophica bacterium]|nr:DegT/DnrJ/EryC1/StrS family aminotransferase [Candidatus Omnitrophota bacterium]